MDWRSDQFSLGLILHEMATGKQTFRRESLPETMTAIIKDEAPALDASIPAPLRWVVERLLEKDPEERYAATKDLARDLRTLRERLSEASGSVAPVAAKRKLPLSVGIAVGLAAGVALALILIPPAETDISQYKFTPLARDEATESEPQWSPDGKSIAYAARIHGVRQIFTRVIDAASAAQITHGSQSCFQLFWSPNGLTIYYWSGAGWWAVGASGGVPRLILKSSTREPAAIHPDGATFAFVRAGKLRLGPLDEGKQREYRTAPFPSQPGFIDLKFSRDGSKLAVAVADLDHSGQGGELWIQPFPSGTGRHIASGSFYSVNWFPDNLRVLVSRYPAPKGSAVVLDTATGRERTIWTSPEYMGRASLDPDGKRIAFTAGADLWDLVEVSLPDGGVSTMLARGGYSMSPNWAPSGTHYLFATNESGRSAIEDRSAKEGFARVLLSIGSEGLPPSARSVAEPRWAPDGQRFAFSAGPQIWVSNASGSRPFTIDPGADLSRVPCWSPDGEWIAYIREKGGKRQLAKVRPSLGASPIILADVVALGIRLQTHWSPAGDWILYPTVEGLSLVSPDGKSQRTLTTRKFTAYGFFKSGEQIIGVFQNTESDGAEWELYSVDVKTGAEKMLAALNLPSNVGAVSGFSLHPDGKRFATSIARWPYDIWMLEGFDQPKSLLDRLLRR